MQKMLAWIVERVLLSAGCFSFVFVIRKIWQHLRENQAAAFRDPENGLRSTRSERAFLLRP